MKKMSWQTTAPQGTPFFLARYDYIPARETALHSHDFAEVMLIESGAGHQRINGTTYHLKPGDLFLIRPADSHAIKAGPKGLSLTNLAFPATLVLDIEARCFPTRHRYFLLNDEQPWSTHLDADSFAQTSALLNRLAGSVRDRFELERTLMNLFAILRKPFSDLPLGRAPDWLRCACAEMHRPAHLAEGTAALIRFAGRSAEHTARELKKHSGCTLTEFVNRLRLDYAAQLLCTTGKTVLEIALDCGFENQGYFHRRFKKRFGTTPLRYRMQNRLPAHAGDPIN